MRKLLFLFVVTMLSVTAMAQDVIYDKTNDAGVRTVVCSGMDLGVSNGEWSTTDRSSRKRWNMNILSTPLIM